LFEALIFDVDGTLAETEEAHRQAFNAAFAEFGLGWVWDEALYRDLLRVTGGKERIRHYVATSGAVQDGSDMDNSPLAFLLHQKKTHIYTEMVRQGGIGLRPGIGAFLEEAGRAGLDLAIATTTSLPNVETLLAAALGSKWRQMFVAIAAGDMVAHKKPAPDVYQLALALLGRQGENCLAIEDSRNGVRSALAAGLQVVAVRSAYTSGDDLSGAIRQLPDCAGLSLGLLQEIAQQEAGGRSRLLEQAAIR
jgi:HAD superfamily hydrolase (TIGR01509 family)